MKQGPKSALTTLTGFISHSKDRNPGKTRASPSSAIEQRNDSNKSKSNLRETQKSRQGLKKVKET